MISFNVYKHEQRGWFYSVEYHINFFAGKGINTLAKHN